jgi:hypothetical protein
MSRSISIGYQDSAGVRASIEIRAPYYLLGTQQTSLAFWSIPRLKEIGIDRLTILGETDPIGYWGWDDMGELRRELALLAEHLPSIDFYPEVKASCLAHLTYCYHLLVATTPKDSRPEMTIG